MRVVMNGLFWDQPSTGSGQYLRELVAALARMDAVEPSLVVGAPPGTPPPPGVEVCERRGLASTNLGKVWFEQVIFPSVCRVAGADVVHVPYFGSPFRCPSPVVVTIHDLIPLLLPEYRGGLHVRAYMALAGWSAKRAALIVTDSEASARDIERVLGIPCDRVRVVHLAAGAQYRPVSPTEVAEARERLGLPERYLLYLGGFDRRKNVPELLRAYRRALPRLGGVALVIAGRFPQTDTAFAPDPRRLVDQLGLRESVHLLGAVTEGDKVPLYAGAVALVYPSLYEGFGLPPLEALRCGTPVIATRASSLPEVVGDGGLLVEPGDTDALAEAMCALSEDAALRVRLAERGLAQASRFSWEWTARQMVAVYQEAVARAQR